MIIAILLGVWEVIKRNIAVTVLWGVTIFIALVIGWPAAIGAMAVATGITQQTPDTSLPATAGIGLAVLATALSGVIHWLGHRRLDSNSTDLPDSRENRVMRLLGRLFLLAALCFTMFAVLWPFIPELKDRTDWWSTAIKYSAAIFLMIGSTILSFSALFGIFETIYRLLQETAALGRASKRLSKK